MADGIRRGLTTEIPGAAIIALSGPAQGSIGVFPGDRCNEGVDQIAGEEVVSLIAACQHQTCQLRQIDCVGEQTGVTGDAVHGMVGHLIVDFAL